jgi:hypothetical protein
VLHYDTRNEGHDQHEHEWDEFAVDSIRRIMSAIEKDWAPKDAPGLKFFAFPLGSPVQPGIVIGPVIADKKPRLCLCSEVAQAGSKILG